MPSSSLQTRSIRIIGPGLPEKRFELDGVKYELAPWGGRRPKSRVIVLLGVGWNPRWGQFPNTSDMKVGPIRFMGLILAGVQIDGERARLITEGIRPVVGNEAALRTTVASALTPVRDYLNEHLQ